MTHTKGPWEVGYCTWNEEGNVCYELRGIKQGCASDARLISAAPDLLEFAEEVRKTGDTRLASMAIAIIAKATGAA